MKKDKFKVTVNGWTKLLCTIILLILAVFIAATIKDTSISVAAFLSILAYTLLFVLLALAGSNNKIANWLSDRKFIINLCLFPTIIIAFYSGVIFASSSSKTFAAFGILLSVLSIPFALILLRIQGGIRRRNALWAFLLFPVCLYILCMIFTKSMLTLALVSSVVTVLLFFVVAVADSFAIHKADDLSEGDKASSSLHCTAKWEGKPNSDIRNNVIHLRGTIIVEHFGNAIQSEIDNAVQSLIDQYVYRVAENMPNYTVDRATLTIKTIQLD